ncbi:unnamed protein product, partial [Nesidiocoris tenuis]
MDDYEGCERVVVKTGNVINNNDILKRPGKTAADEKCYLRTNWTKFCPDSPSSNYTWPNSKLTSNAEASWLRKVLKGGGKRWEKPRFVIPLAVIPLHVLDGASGSLERLPGSGCLERLRPQLLRGSAAADGERREESVVRKPPGGIRGAARLAHSYVPPFRQRRSDGPPGRESETADNSNGLNRDCTWTVHGPWIRAEHRSDKFHRAATHSASASGEGSII